MPYFNRANSYAARENYKKAIEDYNLSIEKFVSFAKIIMPNKNIRINPIFLL